MGTSAAEGTDLWKQIDDAECYLVSGSFDQAVLTALSVSDQIRAANTERVCDDDELLEMLELVGIVLVQALKELRRTTEIFVQLKAMYGSVASIPVKVFLTGATMLMAEGSGPDLRPIFEDFLAKWRYTDDQVYVLNREQERSSNGLIVTSTMATEEYLEVVELYTVTFLSIASDEPENAISWVEKAELIEQDRQFFYRSYLKNFMNYKQLQMKSHPLLQEQNNQQRGTFPLLRKGQHQQHMKMPQQAPRVHPM